MTDRGLSPRDSEDPAREEYAKAMQAARLCQMRKDDWGAYAEVQRAVQLSQYSVEAHDLAAEIARHLALWDDALFHLENAQHLDPQNAERGARLERLRHDAEIYSHAVTDLVASAQEGGGSWLAVFRSVFLRPDPLWYRAGWFHQILAFAGLLLFAFLVHWVVSTGPWIFLVALLDLGMVAWVVYDSHHMGEPAFFWGPVALFGSLFGLALYLTVRGMSSGIGDSRGGRFFSG